MSPDIPSHLYHGTCAGMMRAIIAGGLRPRGARGKKGNWAHSVGSNPRAVYLTNAYPLHYAVAAQRRGDEDLLILETEVARLAPSNLAPDEDFLEQATRRDERFSKIGADMKARTRWFRRRAHAEFAIYWRDSLRGLGTCAYYDIISTQAITRWAVIPARHPIIRASDPTITLMNYRIMGGYYRQLTRYIFDDPPDAADAAIMRDKLNQVVEQGRDGIQVNSFSAPPDRCASMQ